MIHVEKQKIPRNRQIPVSEAIRDRKRTYSGNPDGLPVVAKIELSGIRTRDIRGEGPDCRQIKKSPKKRPF